MDRVVALKMIQPHYTDSPEAVERFRREVKAAARLSHPHIVAAYDAEQVGQTHFLVMEFVEGKTLTEHLREKGSLPLREACALVLQAAKGLQFAAEKGMVHRDIKPDNLILTAAGQLKILDFGLARLDEPMPDQQLPAPEGVPAGLTLAGTVVGTPDYMAPEQARDGSRADSRADIYSLGCTLYQLLTNRVPFPGGTTFDKLIRHAEEQPSPITALRPDVPADVARLVAQMMAKSPEDRPKTPGEVVARLQRIVHPPRRRTRLWAALAVLALLAGGAVWYFAIWPGRGRIEFGGASPHPARRFRITGRDLNGEPWWAQHVTGKGPARVPPGDYSFYWIDNSRGDIFQPQRVRVERGKTVWVGIHPPPVNRPAGEQ
jgi:serine/threonine protein kinase